MRRAPCASLLFLVIPFLQGLRSPFCPLYNVLPLLPCSANVTLFVLPQTPHTSSLPVLSISTFFPPQAPRELLLFPEFLIPSAAPAFVNLLKAQEDSDCSYVPSEEPAKSTSVPGRLGGDPAEFCLLLLALGQASPGSGLTGHACSGCSSWMKDPPEEKLGTGGAVCLRACVRTRVHHYPAAALAPCAGSRIPFIAKFPFSCNPEGASGSCVSGWSSLESPPAFLHVSSPALGEE